MTKQQLRESIRKIIKKELNEALTAAEKKELEDIEYELKHKVNTKSAISPSMYKRYKELKAKEKLAENQPATKPTPKPGVKEKPATPDKKEPRRPFKKPEGQPGPKAEAKKATMKEAEMLKQVIKRFRNKK